MEELVLILLTFIFVLIIYEVFIIAPIKKKRGLNSDYKEIIEIKYLIARYNLDLKKVDYNQLLQICGIVSSFDIALVVSLVAYVHGLVLELIVGFSSATIIILLSYHIVYLFYKKKGMIKNGKHK
jgi:hypothetical protein